MNMSSVLKYVYLVDKVFLLINCYSRNMLDIFITNYEHVISSLVCFLGGYFTNLNFFPQSNHHSRILVDKPARCGGKSKCFVET
jgi:hypothetical protein